MVRLFVAVLSGKGGVGKTTTSVNLALALRNMGYSVGLLDADVYGPNAHLVLGLPDVPPMEDSRVGMLRPAFIQKLGIEFMSVATAIPERTGLALRADYVLDIIRTMIEFTDWRSDIVVIDAPPGSQDVVNYLLGRIAGKTRAVMVTEPHPFSVSDCERLYDILVHLNIPLRAIVVNKYNLFQGVPGSEEAMKELERLASEAGAALVKIPWDQRGLAAALPNPRLFVELARAVIG